MPTTSLPPTNHVDYFTHTFDPLDLHACWAKATKSNAILSNRRLENASWRKFFQMRNNLETISPADLNWSKDTAWLYGPLHEHKSSLASSSPLSATTHDPTSPSHSNTNVTSNSNTDKDYSILKRKTRIKEPCLSSRASSNMKSLATSLMKPSRSSPDLAKLNLSLTAASITTTTSSTTTSTSTYTSSRQNQTKKKVLRFKLAGGILDMSEEQSEETRVRVDGLESVKEKEDVISFCVLPRGCEDKDGWLREHKAPVEVRLSTRFTYDSNEECECDTEQQQEKEREQGGEGGEEREEGDKEQEGDEEKSQRPGTPEASIVESVYGLLSYVRDSIASYARG